MMAKKVLITGASGFIGRNLSAELGRQPELYQPMLADVDTPPQRLSEYLECCECVVHLAGVNRPQNESEFQQGNTDFTRLVLERLVALGNAVPVIMTSSIQAALDNPYGQSKRLAEEVVLAYGRQNQIPVYVFRLPNVFGKWCRPNYNSAVATFCHNIANGLPITVNDPEHDMTLVYIDDVLDLIKAALAGEMVPDASGYCAVPVTHHVKLGAIAEKLHAFHAVKSTNVLPSLGDALDKKLYSTYLSYLPVDAFSYQPTRHADARGLFAEFFKTDGFGQFSVSTTKPGVTRGNHWHHTKVEKFLVVAGSATIRFRRVDDDAVLVYRVTGDCPQVVDIPPGYTHSIQNTSTSETLVTVIWANETFDPDRPDTYYLEV
jgi:UDP-2-acetamido-2,6-beta-L-arabino-hexul-4-ose reductase